MTPIYKLQTWKRIIDEECSKPYMKSLFAFIKQERESGKIIYPPDKDIFNAFWATPLYATKVVILGQDVYHNPNQAHGLAFSVRNGVTLPPSLRNIFTELLDEGLIDAMPKCGDLTPWAQQGVLLLNTVLTVQHGIPMSHANMGWETLTDKVMETVNRCSAVVFMLWGRHARAYADRIDGRHLILESAHPSPMSARNGFFGCGHFQKANDWLLKMGRGIIDWHINKPTPE